MRLTVFTHYILIYIFLSIDFLLYIIGICSEKSSFMEYAFLIEKRINPKNLWVVIILCC